MEYCGQGMVCNLCSQKWRHYLEDAEILLNSNTKFLQRFLVGRTNNVKLDRWSLELQGRNIKVEHIPGHTTRHLIVYPGYLHDQEEK